MKPQAVVPPLPDLADTPSAADFHTRFRRGGVSIAQARRRALHRDVSMRAAALSVTAVIVAASWQVRAAPQDLVTAITQSPPEQSDQIRPMPFETPGDSFPGSAYYYLASDDQPATPGVHGDADAATGADTPGGLTGPGPAARALMTGAGQDHDRALDCLTAAVYYEAASEPDDGQRAVAQVVLNRLAHPLFPKTVCGVVYQGSQRGTGSGCQFTFTCDGALLRQRSRYFWDRAQQVARAALAGYVFRPVGLATHYHTFAVHPVWDAAMNFVGQIGAHRFYRLVGPAGSPAAFRFAYGGGEPLAGAAPQLAATTPDAPDPVALERAYEAAMKQEAAPRLVPAPVIGAAAYGGDAMARGADILDRASKLPDGNRVRGEYQNSGRWISDPL